jgi:hypothetical protein
MSKLNAKKVSTFNFQSDKEARRAEAKAFALEGKLSGSIMTPSYSSSQASSNSIAVLGEDILGDKTCNPFFFWTWLPPWNGKGEDLISIGLLKKPGQKNEEVIDSDIHSFYLRLNVMITTN